jgi:prephenate dehydrogenase
MTSPPERIAVLGTGLIGTSVALAAARAGADVTGWDERAEIAELAASRGGFASAPTLSGAVSGADLVVVATPIASIAKVATQALAASPGAVVIDVGSVKSRVVHDITRLAPAQHLERFVPSHPLGGGERAGPDHASASVVDGIVWVVAPGDLSSPAAVERVERFIERLGAHPARMSPERHDRLVAFVSHLPQVAASALMGLAATEEAGEPDLLLLAAGGFRDLTRLAASDPSLWSEILIANRTEICRAIDLYITRLVSLRDAIRGQDSSTVTGAFEEAKEARLRLAAKPQIRSGVAVLQVEIADRPGALARLSLALGGGEVNIEDLQIVHSPEGGRGTVHLTVAAETADAAATVLQDGGYDPIRLA